jgi:hypothetical protein
VIITPPRGAAQLRAKIFDSRGNSQNQKDYKKQANEAHA